MRRARSRHDLLIARSLEVIGDGGRCLSSATRSSASHASRTSRSGSVARNILRAARHTRRHGRDGAAGVIDEGRDRADYVLTRMGRDPLPVLVNDVSGGTNGSPERGNEPVALLHTGVRAHDA